MPGNLDPFSARFMRPAPIYGAGFRSRGIAAGGAILAPDISSAAMGRAHNKFLIHVRGIVHAEARQERKPLHSSGGLAGYAALAGTRRSCGSIRWRREARVAWTQGIVAPKHRRRREDCDVAQAAQRVVY